MPKRNACPSLIVVYAAFLCTAALFSVIGSPGRAAAADATCVLLFADEDGETLLNRCPDCREVTLSRSRPGASVPSIREMMLPPSAPTPTPFRGPGQTRIVGDHSCPPVPGSALERAGYAR